MPGNFIVLHHESGFCFASRTITAVIDWDRVFKGWEISSCSFQGGCQFSSSALAPPLELSIMGTFSAACGQTCGRTGMWRCCLSLGVVSSIPALGTTIFWLLYELYAFSCVRKSRQQAWLSPEPGNCSKLIQVLKLAPINVKRVVNSPVRWWRWYLKATPSPSRIPKRNDFWYWGVSPGSHCRSFYLGTLLLRSSLIISRTKTRTTGAQSLND